MATAHLESGRKPLARRFGVMRRFPWALALSAILSLVFVIIVAALIAFMQYQTRLLRSQPGITASLLVYYVEAEKKLETETYELGKLSEAISQTTPEVNLENTEIKYRIDRICALFDVGPDATTDKEKCRQFLSRIPFQGTAKISIERLTATPAVQKKKTSESSPSVEPISAELLSSITANFIEIMGEKKVGDVEFKKLISLFQSDLGNIAWLNQDYALRTWPNYVSLAQKYSTTCAHRKQLINIVSRYHPVDLACDENLSDRLTDNVTASGKPAEGGSIISIKTIGDQPSAMQGQPAVGGTIDQAASNSQEPLPSDTPGATQQPSEAATSGRPPASPSDTQRTFELVTHYRFYDRISFGKLRDILISPNDFLALVLVCVGGVLGALLRIVFASYVSGKDPTLRSVVISPILGIICSLVVYNLFRAGFIVITDQSQSSDTAALSPFVIALLAMAAGLLSERTIEFFRKTFGNWLGSVEAGEGARWGVNLQREIDAQKTTVEMLAERLDMSATKVKDWVQEKEPVPNDKQREIALALNVPLRRIFTDLEPIRSG
jgi:hypothetical protein